MHYLRFEQPLFTSGPPCTGHWSLKAQEEKPGPCSAKDCWHCGRREQKSIFHKAEDFKKQMNRSSTCCGTASLREAPRPPVPWRPLPLKGCKC